ncbi:hypothetical protein NO1_0413 [Candidatus Termititenax aidoneus]|uniref:Tetratricopeptide repeat protein n=1 Tax=Termititenax aidoneus TaxID=2218524 RepID=A0A388T8K9_TERA1|nr:hypothetical protein NO1_0413 [Candidatus Termititenax aidoneus]
MRSMLSKKILVFLLLCGILLAAPMRHNEKIKTDYLKYKQLTTQQPNNKDYLFEFAMILAAMGRIEQGGDTLKKINELDENYARAALGKLERSRAAGQDNWWLRFKLGFVYYFLYEEDQGRIDQAKRRIKKNQDSPADQSGQIIARERALITERQPRANRYKEASLANFYLVATKQPEDYLNAWGYAYMATVKAIEKDWPEAKNLIETAVSIEPNAWAIRAAYMEALRQNGNLLAAAGQLTQALKLKAEQESYEKQAFHE